MEPRGVRDLNRSHGREPGLRVGADRGGVLYLRVDDTLRDGRVGEHDVFDEAVDDLGADAFVDEVGFADEEVDAGALLLDERCIVRPVAQ